MLCCSVVGFNALLEFLTEYGSIEVRNGLCFHRRTEVVKGQHAGVC